MSIKNVEKFLNLAKTDEDLKIKLVDVSRSLQKNGGKIPNEEKFIKDKIVPLARKKGVLFTAKDFLKYADKQVTTLSEEDLLNVSGGLSNRSTAAVLLTTFLGSLGVGAAVNLSNLAQDDQISISARKGNTDGGEKFSHENSDEYETKTENNGVIPKIPGLDGNVKTAQNSSAEKREESQPSVGENNIEENVVEAKQKNTTAQENLRKVMQNKNVVLPNTNINPVELQAENPVLDATEINITGEGRNAADLPSAGGMPPEEEIENDSVEFQDDGSLVNASISQMGSEIFDSVSASYGSEGNKGEDSVKNDSMLSTKRSFWDSGSRRFLTSSESTHKRILPRSKSTDSFRSSSGSSSGIFGKGPGDDSVIHTGSSKFNISGLADSAPVSRINRSQSFSDLNLLASKEDSKGPRKILNGSTTDTEDLKGSLDGSVSASAPVTARKDLTKDVLKKEEWTTEFVADLSTVLFDNSEGDGQSFKIKLNNMSPLMKNLKSLMENWGDKSKNTLRINGSDIDEARATELWNYYKTNFENDDEDEDENNILNDSTGSFTGSELGVQNAGYNSFAADLVIVKDGNIRYAYYGDPNEHVYEFDETTGTLTIFKDFAADETAYFDDWDEFIGDIKKVVIRDGVTSIDKDAFSGCSKLTEITIPATVISIGASAFSGCSKLTKITIPANVTSIGASAFSGCSKLTKITIPANVTSIGNNAFTDCSNLTEITIPGKVTSIGTAAFLNCSKLTKIAIPASVTSIGADAFNGCSSLTEITIPASVASIGAYAFANCSELKNVSFEGKDSPNYGGYLIFCDCPDDLVINVLEDYEGDEFCGLNVIKGAQLQGEIDASTNVGHMGKENESSQPGFFKSAATSVYNFITNIFPGSNSSVGQGSIDEKSDDDDNPINNWYGDANDLQIQIPVQQQPQTPSENNAQGQAQQLQASSENNAQAQAQQPSSTREIEVDDEENIVYTYSPFSRLIPATKQVNKLHDFLSKLQVNGKDGLADISTVSQESLEGLKDDISYIANQVKFNPDDGSYTLNAQVFTTDYKKDNPEFAKISQIMLLNGKINGKLEKLIDKAEALQDSENTNNFDGNNNGEENESWFEYISKNKGKVFEYGLVGLGAAYLAYRFGPEIAASVCAALGLGGVPTSQAKGPSAVMQPRDWDNGTNNVSNMPANFTWDINFGSSSPTDFLTNPKYNFDASGATYTSADDSNQTNFAAPHNISSSLNDQNLDLPKDLPRQTPSPMQNPAPQPNNYTAANANITNNLTASATNIANALKSKLSSGLSAVKDRWNGKSTNNTPQDTNNWSESWSEANYIKKVQVNDSKMVKEPVDSTQPQQIPTQMPSPVQTSTPSPNNSHTNASPTSNEAYLSRLWGWTKNTAGNVWNRLRNMGTSNKSTALANTDSDINEIPSALQAVQFLSKNQLVNVERQEPEPETHNKPTNSPFNMDGLSGQVDGDFIQPANATPMQNNGKRTPIEKNAAYFGDNPNNIPINFPELGADEQQKPGRRQKTSVRSYLDDQEVNLPGDPQQPKPEPETHNNPTNSPFNMDGLHWQGAGNSTQPANATQTQMPTVAPSSSWQGAGNSTQSTNATQTQMPTVASSSSKNKSTKNMKAAAEMAIGATGLGVVAAAAIAKQNSYSDARVTYNRVTKTLTIKQDMTLNLDNLIPNHKAIGIDEAKTIVISDGVENVTLYGGDFPNVEKIIVSKTVSNLNLDETYDNFDSIKEIKVDKNNPEYKSIDGVLFVKDNSTDDLELIKFPRGKTDREYKVPENVTCIKANAFDSCPNLERIIIENDLWLESKSFCFCSNLKEVRFNSQSDEEFKNDDAFYVCNNAKLHMTNIDQSQLPDELYGLEVAKATSDGANNSSNLFSYDNNTKTLTIKGNLKKDFDDSEAFLNVPLSEIKTVVIDHGVTNVYLYCDNLTSLETIKLSDTVADFTLHYGFNGSTLKNFEVEGNNPNYMSIDGVLFTKNGEALVSFPPNYTIAEYTVPQNVKTIKKDAFYVCKNLKKITIEKDLTIEVGAFCLCWALETIVFNDDKISTNDNWRSFIGCDNAKVYMPNMAQDQLPEKFCEFTVVKGAPPQQQP